MQPKLDVNNNNNNNNVVSPTTTLSETNNTSNSSSASPSRMAPLFTSKLSQTSTSQKPSSQQSINHNYNNNVNLKRTNADTQTIDHDKTNLTVKRKKTDAGYDTMPLAARVRPASLIDFVGQEELLGTDGILKKLIDTDRIPSMILWGPPGCGKTTIARIISKMTRSRFVELSATSHGAADVKKAFDDAKGHLMLTRQKTIVFIDEIHRFTKVQQDLFLPYVEHGTIQLIGATTENPSFKINSALLSRCKVFVLKKLEQDQIQGILTRALRQWREEDNVQVDTSKDIDALKQLAIYSDGDARTALNTLEIALSLLPSKQCTLEVSTVKGAFQKSHLLYDRNGDQHYDIISALHKSIRGSDANAALYWLGRMLVAGEDPLYIARRLVRCASEDIGLADNTALPLAMAAYNACEKIGMPECDTILAHLVVHLAETKKSVRSYKAYKLVKQFIKEKPAYPVPLHIRNAPTKLMKDLGYGKDYKYNPDYDEPIDQTYLPDEMQDVQFLNKN
ncbi:DNA polymerase III, clamp loader complex, gamma/delta/delta subunit [Cokeromyces recurvatus]|uniref:DNA polymerase III, clamp loader complex, gamma/delta/delta subunit n=1 Tax=Cokeromyces recurvatus TaxID=90255 RepID=UPI00222011BD|nr:DNA polymerase III, clamp loader complex, gamma/delta/delta subunit [Cokeromyces recurvatus]KAI7904560.1 DNA polymerase III, clamp loader complex, gamma/delta/delta subunit [Cokeromyces recurvatus]